MDKEKVLQLAKEAEILRQLSMEVPFVVDRLERFAALIEREVRWDAEPVAWMSPKKERLEFSRADTVYGSHTIPLYTHPAPAVVQQLVDGLAGLIDFIEIDNLRIDQDALRIARAALAAAKEAGYD